MLKFDGYWVDEDNNRWSVNLYSEKDARILSDSLINCQNCRDCDYCKHCIDCVRCINCIDCVDCNHCDNCQSLTNKVNYKFNEAVKKRS